MYDAGWHFSYFTTPEKILKKIQSFSHTEFNTPEFADISHIEDCINRGVDLFNRMDDENLTQNDKFDLSEELVMSLDARYLLSSYYFTKDWFMKEHFHASFQIIIWIIIQQDLSV